MTTRDPDARKPSALAMMMEWRALIETAFLPCALPLLMTTPRGDGHPVLLLPGFMGDTGSLMVLKHFLRNRGYDAQTWGLGRNVGLHSKHANALEQKIRYIHHQTGRKVSLVGWSLGGLFALNAAHQTSDCLRSVVTLGSPVSVDQGDSQAAPLLTALYRMIAHPLGPVAHMMQPRAKKWRERAAPLVPTSCLYSLGDGAVPPREATIDGDPAIHENIRVRGSHTGLGFNAMVLYILADRLAQPEASWKPFNPVGLRGVAYRLTTGRVWPAQGSA